MTCVEVGTNPEFAPLAGGGLPAPEVKPQATITQRLAKSNSASVKAFLITVHTLLLVMILAMMFFVCRGGT
jgi:hypothetical protein